MSAGRAGGGEPSGQIRTEIPATGERGPTTMISSGREVELGARSMLILVEGVFRFDVEPREDTVKTILRNLSGEASAEIRNVPVGGASTVLTGPGELTALATSRFGGEIVLIGADGAERAVAKLLVGSVCDLERGVTSFTAQATLL
ncbi:MAG: hypothetical protein WD827_03460 [Solirubrobacterales bacterium]